MSSTAGVVRLQHLHRVVQVGEQQRVDDEAGPVAADHRVLAQPLDHRARPWPRRPSAVDTVCTISTSRITGAGLKKCRPDDVGRAARGDRALDDRQRRGRRGQDRAGPADLVEVLEQRLLDVELLHDGLDHQVGVGQVVQAGADRQVTQRRVAVGLGQLAALDGLLQALGHARRARGPARRRCARPASRRSRPWRRPRRCRPPSCPSRRHRPAAPRAAKSPGRQRVWASAGRRRPGSSPASSYV